MTRPDPESPEPRPRRRWRRSDIETFTQEARADLETHLAEARAQFDAIDERIQKRTGRNLIMAIAIGLVLGGLLLLSLLVVKELFMLFAAALLTLTVFELASALRFSGRDVPRAPLVITALAIVPATFYLGGTGQWLVYLGGAALVALWRGIEALVKARTGGAKETLADIAAGWFVAAYVALLGSFAVLLVARPDGQWWVLAFLIVVVSCDTGAYASGLLFGRHPMAPRISPKKTWEGFAGSVIVSITAGILLALFMIDQPWWVGAVLGLAIVAAGTLGDLSESLIKRDLGIKDISSWLPGHGGFLDRLDSVLPSSVVAYALAVIVT